MTSMIAGKQNIDKAPAVVAPSRHLSSRFRRLHFLAFDVLDIASGGEVDTVVGVLSDISGTE
jgi:hypothetical protein